jgi:hypothetical protein
MEYTIHMKKKTLLSFFLFFLAVSMGLAQVEKGDLLLGGSFGVNTGNTGGTSSNANLTPHLSMGIGHNSVLGLGFGFNYYTASGGEKEFSVSGNLYYKKYFVLKNKVGWYLQAAGGVGWSRTEQPFLDSTGTVTQKVSSNNNTYTASLTPGIYYQAEPWLFLNADCGGILYSYTHAQDGGWTSEFFVGFLQSFTFGVDFVINNGRRQPAVHLP